MEGNQGKWARRTRGCANQRGYHAPLVPSILILGSTLSFNWLKSQLVLPYTKTIPALLVNFVSKHGGELEQSTSRTC